LPESRSAIEAFAGPDIEQAVRFALATSYCTFVQ
jgi:hypothetical protein